MRRTILFLAILTILSPVSAHAESTTPQPVLPHSTAPVHKEPPLPTNPADRKVVELARALAGELNDAQVTALAGIRVNFGMMRAVRSADRDVGMALDNCARANPPMRGDLGARKTQWRGALNPVLAAQNDNLAIAVKAGTAGDPAKIQAYLDALDQAAADADAKLLKKPVTSEASCKGLLKSMDRTQKTLVEALQHLQWPPLPKPAAPVPASTKP